jgi:purine-binding chemotaxis protein CheW
MRNDEAAPRIDWEKVRGRLAAGQAAVARRLNPDAETVRAVLKERARASARKLDDERPPVESLDVLLFELAGERYAIESRYVREVSPLREFTPVPSTPSFVLGLVNVRGQIYSTIDIRKFFDLPDRGLTDLNKVIILHSAEMDVGVLADAIVGMRAIPVGEITSSLPTLSGIRADFLKGVTRDAVAVLDTGRLLSDPRILVDTDADAG